MNESDGVGGGSDPARPAAGAPVLRGEHVAIEPLTLQHLDDLVVAATEHRPLDCDYTWVPRDRTEMERYIVTVRRQKGRMAFAQRQVASGRAVGCTSFLDPIWWRGRFEPDEVEIGGTWLDRTAQRTAVNTEAKLLLLTHAFERWEVWRVTFTSDARNTGSRGALDRIGASFEGVLRKHRLSHHVDESDQPRDTAVYSIIDTEWPVVKTRLQGRLSQQRDL